MELRAGQAAVVTGAASGIGLALAHAFAARGLNIVMADVQVDALEAAGAAVGERGVEVLTRRVDVSKVEEVEALAAATIERFGAIHVVCNNAGVASRGDAWMGPLAHWEWVMGVNFWGVVHGVRTFLPHLLATEGHMVNTASIAGLLPGFEPAYTASKHAVVGLTEDLYQQMKMAGIKLGVSVLCPGWVRTQIFEADRNWPAELGDKPVGLLGTSIGQVVERAIAEGTTPAAIADVVLDGIEAGRYWLLPHPEFTAIAVKRWESIAEGLDPQVYDIPGIPTAEEVRKTLGLE